MHSDQPEQQTLEVIDDLQPLIRRYYEQFSRCSDCGHIYRAGSHDKRLRRLVERLRDQL